MGNKQSQQDEDDAGDGPAPQLPISDLATVDVAQFSEWDAADRDGHLSAEELLCVRAQRCSPPPPLYNTIKAALWQPDMVTHCFNSIILKSVCGSIFVRNPLCFPLKCLDPSLDPLGS